MSKPVYMCSSVAIKIGFPGQFINLATRTINPTLSGPFKIGPWEMVLYSNIPNIYIFSPTTLNALVGIDATSLYIPALKEPLVSSVQL